MPAQLNLFLGMGNLTADPQIQQTGNGTAVTNFPIALNRKWTSKDGEVKEETCFLDVSCFGRTAESVVQYCRKGKSVHVEGYLKLDQWDDKVTGEKRSRIKLIAERVQFLGERPNDGDNGDQMTVRPGPDRSAPARPREQSSGGHYDANNAPRTGRALFGWASKQEQGGTPGVLKQISDWGQANRLPKRITEWPDNAAQDAYQAVMDSRGF